MPTETQVLIQFFNNRHTCIDCGKEGAISVTQIRPNWKTPSIEEGPVLDGIYIKDLCPSCEWQRERDRLDGYRERKAKEKRLLYKSGRSRLCKSATKTFYKEMAEYIDNPEYAARYPNLYYTDNTGFFLAAESFAKEKEGESEVISLGSVHELGIGYNYGSYRKVSLMVRDKLNEMPLASRVSSKALE